MKKATFARRTLSDMLVSSPTSPELKLLASIEYMRRLEGIKHIVWVGNGLRLASVEDDKRLASRATDAGVTLNVIYTSGVSVQFKDFTGAWDIAAAQRLARETGGFATAVDYADKAVARIAGMNRFPYVLGYVPLNPAFDGKYRNVRVVTRRAGLTVHHAKGYYARDTLSPPDLDELVRDARLKAAAVSTEDANDLPFSATAASARVPQGNAREVVIQINLPGSSLSLRTEGGRHVGDLDFQFFVVDGNRRAIGDIRQRIAIDLDAAGFARTQADGLAHSVRIPVTGPARHVKAVVYDYERDRVGSRLLVVR